jgi:hypothetical protein
MQRLIGPSSRNRAAFGRRAPFIIVAATPDSSASTFADDVRLFATFFLGGMIFMSVYLA